MKTLLLSVALLTALTLTAAEPPKPAAPAPDPYASGQFGLSYFASYRVHDFDGLNNRVGYGPELSYAVTRNFTIAFEGITENPQHSYFDEGGINSKWYLPLGDSGFAAYALLGYTYRFETDLPHDNASSFTASGKTPEPRASADELDDRRHRMNAGIGLELRGKPKSLFGIFTPAVFADGRWTHDFNEVGHAVFRLGGSFGFGHR